MFERYRVKDVVLGHVWPGTYYVTVVRLGRGPIKCRPGLGIGHFYLGLGLAYRPSPALVSTKDDCGRPKVTVVRFQLPLSNLPSPPYYHSLKTFFRAIWGKQEAILIKKQHPLPKYQNGLSRRLYGTPKASYNVHYKTIRKCAAIALEASKLINKYNCLED